MIMQLLSVCVQDVSSLVLLLSGAERWTISVYGHEPTDL